MKGKVALIIAEQSQVRRHPAVATEHSVECVLEMRATIVSRPQ